MSLVKKVSNKPHILITAGPTREKIDAVRDWGNIFSGQTGLDLAFAFLDLGSVTLLTSNQNHAKDFDGFSGKSGMLGIETFSSHADLRDLLQERMTAGDPVHAVAMTAAVADYAPTATYRILSKTTDGNKETWTVENVSAPKVKSTHDQIAVAAKRTEKLIDLFRTEWQFAGTLIKFKLEVDITEPQLLQIASASRLASKADLIVANTLAMARPDNPADAAAYLIDDNGSSRIPRNELASSIVRWAHPRLAL